VFLKVRHINASFTRRLVVEAKKQLESATIQFSQQPFHIPGYYRPVRKPSSERW